MCPACANKRLHAPEDWGQHPYAGHGFAAGQGWSHPDLSSAGAITHGRDCCCTGCVQDRQVPASAATPQISGEVSGEAAPAGRSGQ